MCNMHDVIVGKGNFRGKGVYANRDFKKGEIVINYQLEELDQKKFLELPKEEHAYVHSFWGKSFLFLGPSRYVNHARNPSTYQDLEREADVAARDIAKGEEITTNATQEILNELNTFLLSYEKNKISDLVWSKKGYRNASCHYRLDTVTKILTLRRTYGNWSVIQEIIS